MESIIPHNHQYADTYVPVIVGRRQWNTPPPPGPFRPSPLSLRFWVGTVLVDR